MSDKGAIVPSAQSLQAPISRLLRPLVRLFIRCGLTFPALSELLRELYVNVAETEFALPGKEQTDSRVSLLTGIHRKEVHRLRHAQVPISTIPASLSRTSRIIAHWLADPAYRDGSGAPLALPRSAATGGVSFESLVMDVTRDVRPRAILDEWIDRDIVREDDAGRIVLVEAAYVPKAGDDRRLFYFGRNLHDHIAAATQNVLAVTPPFVERAVHYDRLPEDVSRHLAERSREVAMNALRELNEEAHQATKPGEPVGDWRWNFGVYVYRERSAAAESDGSTPEKGSGG